MVSIWSEKMKFTISSCVPRNTLQTLLVAGKLQSKNQFEFQYKLVIWNGFFSLETYFSDPTIEHQTPFENCKSPEEFYCTEISNDFKSLVTVDIKKQFHYKTWLDAENMYKSIKTSTHRKLNWNIEKIGYFRIFWIEYNLLK